MDKITHLKDMIKDKNKSINEDLKEEEINKETANKKLANLLEKYPKAYVPKYDKETGLPILSKSEYEDWENNRRKILHLKDLIKDITGIVLYNDINDAHILSTIQLEEDIDDIEDSFEATCLNMSDKQLTTISDEDLHRITNVELLDRLVKICKDRLSVNQIKLLQDFYKQKIIIDKEDIQVLLNCVKLCNNLFIGSRYKNIEFIKKYNLNCNDILDIIKNLTVNDYYTNTRSINFNHLRNSLIIFEPTITKNENIINLCIYVKLDIQERTGDTIMLVSIHEIPKSNKLPYKESYDMNKQQEKEIKKDTVNKKLANLLKKYPNAYVPKYDKKTGLPILPKSEYEDWEF